MTPSIPHRQCAGCNRRRPQAELVRVAAVNGRVELDRDRRLGGRGAYLCPNAGCARMAARKGGLGRRLRGRADGIEQLAALLPVEPRGGAW